MANKVYNMDGGLHSSAALGGLEDAMYGSSVANSGSFEVTAGTGMNASIATGDGLISTGTGFARRIATDAVNTVAISAASTANPRIDSVVAYIDNSITPVQTVLNNTNGILKFAAVAGSPASSPVAPSAGAVQSAVGAGNPYMVLCNIRVPANATSLNNAVFTDMRNIANEISDADIADGAISVQKIDWGTMDGSQTGWKYLGQTKLTSTSSSVVFNFPAQYNNYKILFAGEFATGSNTWMDLRLLNGNTPLTGSHQTQDVYGTAWTGELHENVTYHLNTQGCYQYETVNLDFYSLKTGSAQWRKFQGNLYKVGNSYAFRSSNGRLSSATDPTAVEILTGGTFSAGAVIKVWASNN